MASKKVNFSYCSFNVSKNNLMVVHLSYIVLLCQQSWAYLFLICPVTMLNQVLPLSNTMLQYEANISCRISMLTLFLLVFFLNVCFLTG